MSAEPRARGTPPKKRRTLLIILIILGIPAFTAVVLLMGTGIATLINHHSTAKTLQNWGNIGQTFESVNTVFSGLAFVALVVTFRIQFQELRMQRTELEMQRLALKESNGELHRSAEADLRTLHVELIKMSINDPQLAAVWPEFEPDLSVERNRQYSYANLIFQHVRLALQVGEFKEDEARVALRYLFSSPLIRGYWKTTEGVRRTFIMDTSERRFAQLANEIVSELERP